VSIKLSADVVHTGRDRGRVKVLGSLTRLGGPQGAVPVAGPSTVKTLDLEAVLVWRLQQQEGHVRQRLQPASRQRLERGHIVAQSVEERDESARARWPKQEVLERLPNAHAP
jgi:hypothetical protein